MVGLGAELEEEPHKAVIVLGDKLVYLNSYLSLLQTALSIHVV